MIPRFLLAAGLAILMVVSGVTSYLYLGSRQSKALAPPQKPTAATPRGQAFTTRHRLSRAVGRPVPVQRRAPVSTSSRRRTAGRSPPCTPMAATCSPWRSGVFSDVYVLSPYGGVTSQLTNNVAPPAMQLGHRSEHVVVLPAAQPGPTHALDELRRAQTVGANYFDVDLAVWAVPLGGSIRQGKAWTTANSYTGGDVQPVPVALRRDHLHEVLLRRR